MFCAIKSRLQQEESRALARKPREAAADLLGLKFADNIYYLFTFWSQ